MLPRVLLALLATSCVLEKGSGTIVTETLQLDAFAEIQLDAPIDLTLEEGEAFSGAFTCDDNLVDNVQFEVDTDAGVLTISTPLLDQGFRPTERCSASLVVVDLVRLHNNGSGEVEAGVLPSLKVARAARSGGMVVAGMGGPDALVATAGSGSVTVDDASLAESLLAQVDAASGSVSVGGIAASQVNVANEGSGDVTLVGTTDDLDLRVRNSGNVDAEELVAVRATVDLSSSGSATITVTNRVTGEVSGSGDLVVLGEPVIDVQTTGSGVVR